LKYLAATAEERTAAGNFEHEKITGQQRRLGIALAFLPADDVPLPLTRALAEARTERVRESAPAAADEVAAACLRPTGSRYGRSRAASRTAGRCSVGAPSIATPLRFRRVCGPEAGR
jgi:hypothetical protein